MTATQEAPARQVKTRLPEEYQSVPLEPYPLGQFLGWFSIGLGLAEALAPRDMSTRTGVRNLSLLRAYGLREIAAGVGILTSRPPTGWLWARVAGDALDLATLAAAWHQGSFADRRRTCLAAAAVAGVTALDVLAARRQGRAGN